MRIVVHSFVILALIGASPCSAQIGAYPNKPMRWVVPFAPGGGTDVVVRPIALKFSERVGQSVLYENRGGAGGVIAGEIVARATPDGYTLLVAAVAVMTVNSSLMKQPFDPLKDFAPVTKFATVPSILCARASLPVKTVQELVPYARANPGKIVWAMSGVGSGGHLAVEMFRLADSRECRHQALTRYFDETLAPCGGSCDVCRGEGIDALIAAVPRGLAKLPRAPRAVADARAGASAAEPAAVDPETFERLRALRRKLANAEGVPAYIVFSDAVLRAMAELKPRSPAELLQVPGVGLVKLERYGEAFLRELAAE